MIYPADDLSEGKQYYEAVMSQNAENIDGDHIIYNDAYLLAQTSDYTGFSTVVAVDQNQLLAPIRSYLFTNLGLLFFYNAFYYCFVVFYRPLHQQAVKSDFI